MPQPCMKLRRMAFYCVLDSAEAPLDGVILLQLPLNQRVVQKNISPGIVVLDNPVRGKLGTIFGVCASDKFPKYFIEAF